MPTNKVLFSDIIKFFIAVIIILLGFLWKGEKVGETQESLFFQEYLQKETISLEPTTHFSAEDEDKCTTQDILCKKIRSEDHDDVLPYKNEVYDSTYFINNNQILKKRIVDALKKIEIKNTDEEKRGYATRDTIVLNIAPTNDLKEFQNLSTHELSHIFDLGVMQGNSSTKSKIFTEFSKAVFSTNDPSLLFYKLSRESEKIRKKEAIKKDFCSGYGMTDPFEDFAECFNLYVNNQSFFRFIATKNKILAKKYNFIATLLQGNYREKNTESIALLKENTQRRPWDTTKL